MSFQQYEDITKHVTRTKSLGTAVSSAHHATHLEEDPIPEEEGAIMVPPMDMQAHRHNEHVGSSSTLKSASPSHFRSEYSGLRDELPLLFFSPTAAGYEARLRLETLMLAIQQAQQEAERLRQAIMSLLPLIPGNGPMRGSQ